MRCPIWKVEDITYFHKNRVFDNEKFKISWLGFINRIIRRNRFASMFTL